MDVAIPVSEILLLSKTLKKFMQVEVNVLCMHINFDGCRHSGFRDIATFKNAQKIHASRGQCIVHAHQL